MLRRLHTLPSLLATRRSACRHAHSLMTRTQAQAAKAGLVKKEEDGVTVKAEPRQRQSLRQAKTSKVAPTFDDDVKDKKLTQAPRSSKKRTAAKADLDVDPFPEWPKPTPEQCEEVFLLLSKLHGDVPVPRITADPEAEEDTTTAAVKRRKSVLHSLVGTIISCNTTAANCRAAIDGLSRDFPLGGEWKDFDDGVDYEKVRTADMAAICDAIRPAGLANIRGKNIKAILQTVYQENLEQGSKDTKLTSIKSEPAEDDTLTLLPSSVTTLSLEYLRSLPTPAVQERLMRFPGVGVKVAACVLSFNLHRPVFAVDTHVFRLSKWLGWVPPEKSNEVTTFRHLQATIPDQLKYPLHILLVTHGRQCLHCKAMIARDKKVAGGPASGKECVLEHLLKRSRKSKLV